SSCKVPICVNGGTLSESKTQCLCSKGYSGPHCEYEECTEPSPVTFSTDAKTLVLVVEVTKQSLEAVKGLTSRLETIVNDAIADHPNWFADYVLVTFDCK
ncbi:hypothetical protein OSTOST_19452, partial [Ostertagia ostertagi]